MLDLDAQNVTEASSLHILLQKTAEWKRSEVLVTARPRVHGLLCLEKC